jgi:uncharacterized membrane protein
MQMRMRDLAQEAARMGTGLPLQYHRLYWCWFGFGLPAVAAVVAKPQLW